jgi:hypothetical protein
MALKHSTTWLRTLVATLAALTLQIAAVNALPMVAKSVPDASALTLVLPVQSAPGNNDGGRICQTLRNCRYTPGGSFRGCVSSYSCRTCRYVVAKCTVGASSGQCRRQVCDWGG